MFVAHHSSSTSTLSDTIKDSPSASTGQGLDTKLIGCLMPGRGFLNFWTTPRYPHGSSLIATILLVTLQRVFEREGELPPGLFIQADNCGRENKNQVVFRLCAWLVQQGLVKEVQLMFLPVGHTHAEIDQRWSVLSQALRHADCITPGHLKEKASIAFTKSDGWYESFDVNEVIDFDGVFPKEVCREFSGHGTSRRWGDERTKRRMHMFRFSMVGGQACIQFKEHDTPSPWKGDWLQDEPIPVFKKTGIKLPTKLPILPREPVPNVAEIKKKVEALEIWLRVPEELTDFLAAHGDGLQGQFNDKLVQGPLWWRAFLAEEEEWQKSKCQARFCTQWQFSDLLTARARCKPFTERGLALLLRLDRRQYDVQFPQYPRDLCLFTADKMPPKSHRFDPEEDLELGDIVVVQFQKEGTTFERGWELGQLVDVDYTTRTVTVEYLEPKARRPHGPWDGEWWKQPLVLVGRLDEDSGTDVQMDLEEIPMACIIWAGTMTTASKVTAMCVQPFLAAISQREKALETAAAAAQSSESVE